MTTTAAALKVLRLERGLSQAKAGQLAGMSQQYIDAIEAGRLYNIDKAISRLNKLLAVYGKRISVTIEENDNANT